MVAPVAQWIEQVFARDRVAGSNPAGCTIADLNEACPGRFITSAPHMPLFAPSSTSILLTTCTLSALITSLTHLRAVRQALGAEARRAETRNPRPGEPERGEHSGVHISGLILEKLSGTPALDEPDGARLGGME